jgi:heme/copper-type cytochrome/quinol oxidase subunit 4
VSAISPRPETQHGAHAGPHGAQPAAPGAPHALGRIHAVVALVLAVLTVVAFVAVGQGLLPASQLFPLLLALALVQICLQVLFYMRLRWDSRIVALLFGMGLGLAVLITVAVKILLTKF